MQMVHAFQEFNGPYMITEGGPLHSTYVLSLYIYDQSFKYFNLGYGSALSWVLVRDRGGSQCNLFLHIQILGLLLR